MINIVDVVKGIRNGSFFSICYKSELPVSAENKKAGIKVVKQTSKVARTGVEYKNIEAVKILSEGVSKEPSNRVNNFVPIINNKIVHNNKTNKDYITFANVPGARPSSVYTKIIHGVETIINRDEALSLCVPSYGKNDKDIPIVQKVTLSNVVSINSIKFN